MDRRQFLTRTVGTCALGLSVGSIASKVAARTTLTVGDIQIDTVSDGHLVVPQSFVFADLPEEDLKPILKRFGIEGAEVEPDCNLTLLRDGKRTILFDAGAGPNFVPTTGKTLSSLEVLGVDPSEITHVVFTHAHPDHLWGILDEFEDFTFPEAEYLINQTEWDYWTNPETVSLLSDARKPFAVGAGRSLSAIEDRVSFFKDGDDLFSGIHAVGTPGHTPGHTSFAVSDGRNNAMIVGDAVANHHVAFEQPKWVSGTDQDQSLGAKTRTALLDQAATDGMTLVGFHLPFPGVGSVEKKGAGYRFNPIDG